MTPPSAAQTLTSMSDLHPSMSRFLVTRASAARLDDRGPPLAVWKSRMSFMTRLSRLISGVIAVAAVAVGTLGFAAPAFAAAPGAPPRVVAFLGASGDNVAPQILAAANELAKDHMQRTGAYTVVTPAGPPSAVEPNAAEAAKQATALGADQAIVLHLTHYGNSARIRLNAYAAGTAQLVYWDSTVIAGGPDELDVVIQRLVHAMEIGRPVRDSAELETVTDKEMETLKRRTANHTVGAHIFTLVGLGTASGEVETIPGGGLFLLYDARSWMADLSFDFGSNSFGAAIGGYYPLLREDFTPYFGAVVRLARVELGGQGAGGILLQPTVGLLLGRLSSVQLRAEAGYFIATFGERENSADPSVNPPRHIGHGLAINVGIGF
jgi:hypothetical protein